MRRSEFALILTALFFSFAFPTHAAFDANLSYGSRNKSAVIELQQFLLDQGVYGGPVTGNFLTLTRTGVQAFQIREKIYPALGYFGPLTRTRAKELARAKIQAEITNLENKLSDLQRLAVPPAQSTSTAILAGSPVSASPETLINARSIVGLDCIYSGPNGETAEARGSGVLITPDGAILTVRHLVDLKYSARLDPGSVSDYMAQNYSLDHCDVGQVPSGSVLPSPDVIRSLNPIIPVPGLYYRAGLTYVPQSAGLSQSEADHLDFALLKISGLSDAGKITVGVSMPASFDHSPLDRSGAMPASTQVLTYGYPGDVTRGMGQQFSRLYLLGSVGRVREVYGGDAAFFNQPFVVNTEMEVRGGRSGSPLFLNGKVVGIVTAHSADNVTDSFSVSSGAIYKIISNVISDLPN